MSRGGAAVLRGGGLGRGEVEEARRRRLVWGGDPRDVEAADGVADGLGRSGLRTRVRVYKKQIDGGHHQSCLVLFDDSWHLLCPLLCASERSCKLGGAARLFKTSKAPPARFQTFAGEVGGGCARGRGLRE